MKAKHRKTLSAIFSDPVNGNLEWGKIEALLIALGCRAIEGAGSSVTFEKDRIRAYFHRPHPARAALRYRVKDAREFLTKIGASKL
ncbi:MAG: type II toxin-antitoxin system HicA family toxin [Deltaproteobacteria bacterium]|nr:type II toxin-antitoxin system HicA family toxin [Deltaproteobacteria bacterium]